MLESINFSSYCPSFLNYSSNNRVDYSLQKAISSGDIYFFNSNHLKVELDQPLPNGELPLHYAVCEQQYEVVDLMIKQGADLTQLDNQQLSVLDHAILQKDDKMLEILIKQEPSNENEQYTAAVDKPRILESYSQLASIKKELKKLLKEKQGFYLLPLASSILENDVERLKNLLERGEDVNTVIGGKSITHLAAMMGSSEVIQLLIKHGADLNATDLLGNTPAHYAALNDDPKVITILVEKGLNISSEGVVRVSPLALLKISVKERDPLKTDTFHRNMILSVLGSEILDHEGKSFRLFLSEEWKDFSRIALGSIYYTAIAQYCNQSTLTNYVFRILSLRYVYAKYKGFLDNMHEMSDDMLFNVFLSAVGDSVTIALEVQMAARMLFSSVGIVKSAYKNARYRPWDTAKKLAIHFGCLSTVLYSSYNWAQGQGFWNKGRFKRPTCPVKIDKNKFVNATVCERLTSKELCPDYKEHAVFMIDPNANSANVEKKQLKRAYRKLAAQIHPDSQNKIECAADAFYRLADAYETVNGA